MTPTCIASLAPECRNFPQNQFHVIPRDDGPPAATKIDMQDTFPEPRLLKHSQHLDPPAPSPCHLDSQREGVQDLAGTSTRNPIVRTREATVIFELASLRTL
jgi:hypothetical protein